MNPNALAKALTLTNTSDRLHDVKDVRGVVDAWSNPGPRPEHHYKMQDILRKEWPVLANALDQLTKT